jgi:tetratricopeptide (TPR) repeat protein
MEKIKSLTYCLFFTLIALSATFGQEMKPEAAKLYNDGNKMLKEGNYENAINNYDQALKVEEDFRIYYQRGVALKMSGKLEDSKNSFENCLKLKPDFEAGFNALGGVYFAMGKYSEAAGNFEKVLAAAKSDNVKEKIKKNLSLVYAKMGNEANNDGNTKKAVEDFTKATEFSNYDAAYLALAKTYSDMGQYDKSLENAQNALKYKSSIGKGGPYYYMGVAYKNKGDKEKAKEMFDQAKTDPNYKKLAEYELTALK